MKSTSTTSIESISPTNQDEVLSVLDLESIIAQFETKVFNTALALTGSVAKSERVLFKVFSSLAAQLQAGNSREKLFDQVIGLTMDLAIQSCIEGDCDEDLDGQRLSSHEVAVTESFTQAILSLDICSRMVFVLRDIQGIKLAKVAEILGTNVFSVGRYLRAARLKICEELRPLSQLEMPL